MQDPLIWLPDSCVAIFPDQIVQYPKSQGKVLSITNTTLPSLNDLQQAERVLSFAKSDIAFKINEKQRKISIVKIKKEKVEFEFVVETQKELIIVQ